MIRNMKHCVRGVTIIEILVVLAMLVVLVSVAAPSITGANSAMQLRAATENVEHSIDMARNTARMAESPVTMKISTEDGTGQHIISFSLSEKARKKLSQTSLPEFRLDETLALQSDFSSYEFDSRGAVNNPGELTLFVKDEKDMTASFILK